MSAYLSRTWRAAAVAFLLGLSASSHSAVVTGPVTNPANGHLYYLLSQGTWTASEAEAQSMGGHLVTINDAAEDAWVYQQFASYGGVVHNLWIGLTDAASEGTWVWTSGEALSYTHWVPGDPNNLPPSENYGIMWGANSGFAYNGFWNDLPDSANSYPAFGVVEIAKPVFARTQSLRLTGSGWGDAGLFNCGLSRWDASTSGYGTFTLTYPFLYNEINGGGYYGLVVNDRTLGRFVEVIWLWDDDLN